MNRLFIIGNGFDLAHGYKSSYPNFLFILIKSELVKMIEDSEITSPFFHFQIISTATTQVSDQIIASQDLEELLETLKYQNDKRLINFNFYLLFQQIAKNLKSGNWVDIEWSYFEALKTFISTSNSERSIVELNVTFELLRKNLEEYILNLKPKKKEIPKYKKVIESFQNTSGSNNLIINFNYTRTAHAYFPEKDRNKFEIVDIHGEAGNSDNPIVFGYGDETTEYYKEIEDLNSNHALKNIKSFKYLSYGHYKKIRRFFNLSNPPNGGFIVEILGHSCGISDRVLMKEIFEHQNCKGITVHHHNGRESFEQTVMNISRHFASNSEMRLKKLQDYNPELKMPQWDD